MSSSMEVEVKLEQQKQEQQQVKSKGKQKIIIKGITNYGKRHVTFSKRRTGLFKKGAELSRLSGSQIAIIAFSGAGKVFSFGSPSADSVINRYVNLSCGSSNSIDSGSGFWWDEPISDNMGLVELDQFRTSLQGLRNQVVSRVNELRNPRNQEDHASMIMMNFSASASAPQPQSFDSFGFTTDQHSEFVQECIPVQDFDFGSSEFIMDKDSAFVQDSSAVQDFGFGSSAFVQDVGLASYEFMMDKNSAFVQECTLVQDCDFGVMDQDCAVQGDVCASDGKESWLDLIFKDL